MNPEWVDDVLRFWFDEVGPKEWFSRSERVDAQVRERFEDLHQAVKSMTANELSTPSACLAAVIVLDQFPRNMYRNSPRAYAEFLKAHPGF